VRLSAATDGIVEVERSDATGGLRVETASGTEFLVECNGRPGLVTGDVIVCFERESAQDPIYKCRVIDYRTVTTLSAGHASDEGVTVSPDGKTLAIYDPKVGHLQLMTLPFSPTSTRTIKFSVKPDYFYLGFWSPDSSLLFLGIDWPGTQSIQAKDAPHPAVLDLRDLSIYQIADPTTSRMTQAFSLPR
jgi:hypothetical protein